MIREGKKIGEVAGASRVRRNDDVVDQASTQALTLVVEEEEGAVLAVVEMRNRERSADVSAELIALLPSGA